MAKEFIDETILDIFSLNKIDIKEYSFLKYPSFIPLLKMNVDLYSVNDFGYIMIMKTRMSKLMSLVTISFTPKEGKNVPFLLIDTMSMGKKRLAYVEFYNTSTKDSFSSLEELNEKYKSILDHKEKDAWYVNERMSGSLIKEGTSKNEFDLKMMIIDALNRYKEVINNASIDLESITNLKKFQEKMITLGNPSSSTLNKILGNEEAINFFKNIIMPIK